MFLASWLFCVLASRVRLFESFAFPAPVRQPFCFVGLCGFWWLLLALAFCILRFPSSSPAGGFGALAAFRNIFVFGFPHALSGKCLCIYVFVYVYSYVYVCVYVCNLCNLYVCLSLRLRFFEHHGGPPPAAFNLFRRINAPFVECSLLPRCLLPFSVCTAANHP